MRVFDSLSFPTLILKPDRKIINANQILMKNYRISRERLLGMTCHEFFYDSEHPCREDTCPLPKVLADKKGHSSLRHVVTESGDERWEERVFSPILDDNGEVKYILESVRDVSRLKVLEKELIETRDFMEKIVHGSPSAIVVADRQGEIVLMNEAAEDLFGYTVEEAARTKNVEALYPPGVARDIMKRLRDEKIGGVGKLPSTKVTIIRAGGEEIPAEITASIIYEEEVEVATMGIFFDLREKLAVEQKLKEAQAQLAQSEKMASLGQLAAGVAHEINNPLTGILFYANLAQETLKKDNPLYQNLGYVIEDVHRCSGIVKNLLAYSRQTSQTKNIAQLNELVDQSLALIRDPRLFRNIEVAKNMSSEMMLVHGDKNQLSQVMINLVMNAVASMDGQGTLTLRTYRNKLIQKVYLEVEDTGCGIPEENLSKIFDPFFSTKELGKGTGLGLSTAYGIIQENGGCISVKKTSPQGTVFLLELPLYQPSEDAEL